MEDVLDVYQRPYDSHCPVVCMDESNKQLSIEVRSPIPAGPGQVRCEDGEWKRNGVADIFMFVEPLKGRRFTSVTEKREAIDWAHQIKELLTVHYLNNLTGASLHRTRLFKAIGRHIGTGNRFAFMNGEGQTIICNEDQGIWRDRLWFSNHSFLPRRAFPFASCYADWFCEDCGRLVDTSEEIAEGLCLECLERFETSFSQCTGCYEILPSAAHREVGWCDDCGFNVYGRKWPEMLRGAVEAKERDATFPEWF